MRQRRLRLLAVLLASITVTGLVPQGTAEPTVDVREEVQRVCGKHAPHPPIHIEGDEGPQGFALAREPTTGAALWRPGSGVVEGNGTAENPYVIEGWCIRSAGAPFLAWISQDIHPPPEELADAIRIQDTSAHVVIRDNHLTGAFRTGIVPLEGGAEGIEVTNASNVSIEDNTITAHNGHGLVLEDTPGVVIEENIVSNNERSGIELRNAPGALLAGNTVADNGVEEGIQVRSSDGVELVDNLLQENRFEGIELSHSTGARLEANTFEGDGGLAVRGPQLSHYLHEIDASNTVDGDPIRYVRQDHGARVLAPAGQVLVAGAENVTVEGLALEYTQVGIQAAFADNLTVQNTTLRDHRVGIDLFATDRALLEDNTLQHNRLGPVQQPRGAFHVVFAIQGAIDLDESDGVRISNNRIAHNDDGIQAHESHGLEILRNVVAGNEHHGIDLWSSEDARVHQNSIVDNEDGLLARQLAEPADARHNWWGDPSGPSGNATDACTGTRADGNGDGISTYRADVCFEPWLDSPNPDAGRG